MTSILQHKKVIAIFFLTVMLTQILPVVTKAQQKDSKPYLDVSNWVNLFTGDLNYSIPLLDMPSAGGNYPIALTYQSGSHSDKTSGWVGLGWDLSIGSIRREVNGVPDEFAGDSILALHIAEPSVTVGAGAGVSEEVLGRKQPQIQSETVARNFNIYQNNQLGLGYSLDNLVGYQNTISTIETRGLENSLFEEYTDGLSFPSLKIETHFKHPLLQAPYIPVAIENSTFSYSHKQGNAWAGSFSYGQIIGYYHTQSLKNSNQWVKYPAFGSTYGEQVLSSNSVVDVSTHDNTPLTRTADLPVHRLQSDRFLLKDAGTQYSLMVSPMSTFLLPQVTQQVMSISHGQGIDRAAASHEGNDKTILTGYSYSGLWRDSLNTTETGEKDGRYPCQISLESTQNRVASRKKMLDISPVQLALNGKGKDVRLADNAISSLADANPIIIGKEESIQVFTNNDILNVEGVELLPELRISYRDAMGTDATLRRDQYPSHHWAAITTLKPDGNRYVYGLPSYVLNHEELVFSGVKENDSQFVAVGNQAGELPQYEHQGVSSFVSYQKTPKYAEEFLLTAVLGSDYVDVTKDGVTDDDLGYWVKFSYQKVTSDTDPFKERKPFIKASFMPGGPTKKDDKGILSVTEKEIWYIDRIETNSHIAEFVTDERMDGYGAKYVLQDAPLLGKSQRALKEIRLYSKALGTTTPVRVVKMEYDYSLYPGQIDSRQGVGKLTLKKLWFEGYQNTRGAKNAYLFEYVGEHQENIGLEDGWGVLNSSKNPTLFNNGDQHRSKPNRDEAMSYGNLKSLTTPTGEVIDIQYESDDYAYVQHFEAKQMTALVSDESINDNDLRVKFKLHSPVDNLSSDEQRKLIIAYLGDQNTVPFQIRVNLLDKDLLQFDEVLGLATIDFSKSMGVEKDDAGNFTIGYFHLLAERGRHPFSLAAWNHLLKKSPYLMPQPGEVEITQDQLKQQGQIEKLIAAASQLRKMYQDFHSFCADREWGRMLDVNSSMVRLNLPNKSKLGGDSRVKQITVKNSWEQDEEDITGFWFDYTRKENDHFISSGVAENEPYIYRVENPLADKFPQWVNAYPQAKIGYAQVNVYTLASARLAGKPIREWNYFPQGNEVTFGTKGMTTFQFYTAKDFPTIILATDRENRSYSTGDQSDFSIDQIVSTQGYSIIKNDMHGRLKKVSSYRQYPSGAFESVPYASETFEYLSKPFVYNGKQVNMLDNGFVEDAEGLLCHESQNPSHNLSQTYSQMVDLQQISNEIWQLGEEENVDDMSMSLYSHSPVSIQLAGSVSHVRHAATSIRTAVVQTFIEQRGIQSGKLTYSDGRVEYTNHLKYDMFTNRPVLSASGNGRDIRIFSQDIPAYRKFSQMGPASHSCGKTIEISSVNKVKDRVYKFTSAEDAVVPGDQLVIYYTSAGKSPLAIGTAVCIGIEGGTQQLVSSIDLDMDGYSVKVVRSGYTNQLNEILTHLRTTTSPAWKTETTKSKSFIIPK